MSKSKNDHYNRDFEDDDDLPEEYRRSFRKLTKHEERERAKEQRLAEKMIAIEPPDKDE